MFHETTYHFIILVLLIIVVSLLFALFYMRLNILRIRGHLEQVDAEVKSRNLELEAINEELVATNEEYEAINQEFSISQEDLIESEKKFRSILEMSPYPIAIVNNNGFVDLVNVAFTKSFGYDIVDIPNLDVWGEKAFPNVDQYKIMRGYPTVVGGNLELGDQVMNEEAYIVAKNGKKHLVDFKLVSINDFVLVVMNDLTEKRRNQELMLKSEKMVTVGGLAAGIAHEVNNPLAIISHSVQNIYRKLLPDIKGNESALVKLNLDFVALKGYLEERGIMRYLTLIDNASSRAAKIIENLLKFSRKAELAKTSVKIIDIVDNSIEIALKDYDYESGYDFRNINIVINCKNRSLKISCIEIEIEQVFVGILLYLSKTMNISKYKNFQPKIDISIYQEEGNAIVEISDNGPTLDEVSLNHIFDPFCTTVDGKPVGDLTLSVANFIVSNNHHGDLTVELGDGDIGTNFKVSLPVEG